MTDDEMHRLLKEIRACRMCAGLPLGPRPIVQAHKDARILIAGQAPGRVTHHKGVSFDDPSGNRLRGWLGVTRQQFYDPHLFAIVPMGFCFPGNAKGGDLPPRPECAPAWRNDLLASLENIELTIVTGSYALDWHLGKSRARTLKETVLNWRAFWPDVMPLPHPSPRNIRWFRQNPWFEKDVIPVLKKRVARITGQG